MTLRRLRVYSRLPPVEPSGHGFFSQRVPPAPSHPFPSPKNPSHWLPEPAFSDTSPLLGDIGIVSLGVAAWAIPTEATVHLSAPACWQINVSSNGFPSAVGQSNSAFNEQPGLACSDYPYTPIRRGFEPATCGLGNPSNFAILLARLAFSYLLLAGFGWYSGVIVPKLFPSFRSALSA